MTATVKGAGKVGYSSTYWYEPIWPDIEKTPSLNSIDVGAKYVFSGQVHRH